MAWIAHSKLSKTCVSPPLVISIVLSYSLPQTSQVAMRCAYPARSTRRTLPPATRAPPTPSSSGGRGGAGRGFRGSGLCRIRLGPRRGRLRLRCGRLFGRGGRLLVRLGLLRGGLLGGLVLGARRLLLRPAEQRGAPVVLADRAPGDQLRHRQRQHADDERQGGGPEDDVVGDPAPAGRPASRLAAVDPRR